MSRRMVRMEVNSEVKASLKCGPCVGKVLNGRVVNGIRRAKGAACDSSGIPFIAHPNRA